VPETKTTFAIVGAGAGGSCAGMVERDGLASFEAGRAGAGHANP